MSESKKKSEILQKSLLIYGLGRAGTSLARFLVGKGIITYAFDDNPKVRENELVKELTQSHNFKLIADIKKVKPEIVICSPGIRSESQIIADLTKREISIIDEIEFTSYFVDKPIIAITGTNGKSTTTALIGLILMSDQRKVFYGGNLAPGSPFSAALLDEPKDFYVVEVSSFQLERCQDFSPKIALLLNITEDHFDRHQSKAEYVALKFRIFAQQNKDDFAIVNFDDPVIMANISKIRSKIFFFSTEKVVAGAYYRNGKIYFKNEAVCSTQSVKIAGKHNLKNVLAAVCAAKIIGVKNKSIESVLLKFTGLPHRLELVRELGGVKYINNSMCTNPDAGINSLDAISTPIIIITGGKEKNLVIEEYMKVIAKRAKYTILIGENRNRLRTGLEKLHYDQMEVVDSLEKAVNSARAKAAKGDTVLFSPGFASFDSYVNFMERGEAFRNVVGNLT
jgi:UDP-N-acetylmuramoylalanine--D-glutamate ligase